MKRLFYAVDGGESKGRFAFDETCLKRQAIKRLQSVDIGVGERPLNGRSQVVLKFCPLKDKRYLCVRSAGDGLSNDGCTVMQTVAKAVRDAVVDKLQVVRKSMGKCFIGYEA